MYKFRELTEDEIRLVSGGTEVITVTGYRISVWDSSWGGGGGSTGGGDYGMDTENPDLRETPPDCQSQDLDFTEAFDPNSQQNKDRASTLWDYRQNVIINLSGLPSASYFTNGPVTIYSTEIYTLLTHADYKITHISDFGNGGVGTSDRNGGDPIFTIYSEAFDNYMSSPSNAFYYLLHETAHVTEVGYNLWQSGGNSAALEQFANDLYRAVASAAGLPILPNAPGGGYSSVPFTFNQNLAESNGTTVADAAHGAGC